MTKIDRIVARVVRGEFTEDICDAESCAPEYVRTACYRRGVKIPLSRAAHDRHMAGVIRQHADAILSAAAADISYSKTMCKCGLTKMCAECPRQFTQEIEAAIEPLLRLRSVTNNGSAGPLFASADQDAGA